MSTQPSASAPASAPTLTPALTPAQAMARRWLTLDLFLAHRRPVRREPVLAVPPVVRPQGVAPLPTVLTLRAGAAAPQMGRQAAEGALEAGSERFYAPRRESQLLTGR
ncbi:hypothetical protein [Roseateles sp. BYS87W]|uniref:Uncharacterized protein n=1 Tax=Pelomonas baiyunensis TaxID=3299026 RepID=A0ABW7H1I2_9BURK